MNRFNVRFFNSSKKEFLEMPLHSIEPGVYNLFEICKIPNPGDIINHSGKLYTVHKVLYDLENIELNYITIILIDNIARELYNGLSVKSI